jgi:hypothetical protein
MPEGGDLNAVWNDFFEQHHARDAGVPRIKTFVSKSDSERVSGRLRNDQTERLGGLEIDHQLVLGRSLHRQFGRLLALQDAIDIAGRKPGLAYPKTIGNSPDSIQPRYALTPC